MARPIYDWDENTGVASCLIQEGELYGLGFAHCAPEDRDMLSEKTGCTIALFRANIGLLKKKRDYILKPKIAALKQLYYCMAQSAKFNENSYENKSLQRELRVYQNQLSVVNQELTTELQNLKVFLEKKANFYKQIRDLRKENAGNED